MIEKVVVNPQFVMRCLRTGPPSGSEFQVNCRRSSPDVAVFSSFASH